MATVTAPIMTDATGQSIDSKLNSLLGKMDNLAAAFQPNASGIVYSNTTSGLTGDDVQEAIDEMAADVSEIKSSLSNFGNIKVYQFFNTATLAIDLGFTPTSAKNGNAIMFNGNQGSAAIFRLDTSPSALNIAGSKTWTCTQSGSVVTFTANSTLWGVTTVIVDHN